VLKILALCVGVYVGNDVAWKVADLVAPTSANPLVLSLRALLVVVFALGVYALLVRVLEKRAASELTVRELPGMAIGFALGIMLIVLSMGFVSLFSSVKTEWMGFDLPVYSVLLEALAVGVTEELLFRCALQRPIADRFGSSGALLVSASVFGFAHLANPGATPWSAFCVAVGGLLLGLVFMLSRSLWLPAGLHAGWNFAQAGLFGVVVSGRSLPGMLKTSVTGSVAVTGGRFGIEASAITLLVLVGACATVGLLLKRRAVLAKVSDTKPVLESD
jgi:hypothetical protein